MNLRANTLLKGNAIMVRTLFFDKFRMLILFRIVEGIAGFSAVLESLFEYDDMTIDCKTMSFNIAYLLSKIIQLDCSVV